MTKIPRTQYERIHNLHTEKGLNKAEIARMYGISRARVGQIIDLSTDKNLRLKQSGVHSK